MASGYQQLDERSLSEYVENCCSKIINKVHVRVFALCYFAKDDVYNCLSFSMKALTDSCFGRRFNV